MDSKKLIIIALIAVAAIVAFFVFTAPPTQVINPATGLPYPPNVINPATGLPYNPVSTTGTTGSTPGVGVTVPNSNVGVVTSADRAAQMGCEAGYVNSGNGCVKSTIIPAVDGKCAPGYFVSATGNCKPLMGV